MTTTIQNITKQLIKKLTDLEIEVAKEKGTFDLFALFSGDAVLERWDLVVSATWIGQQRIDPLEYLTDKLRSYLTTDEFEKIAKIVPLDVYDPRVKEIQKLVTTEHKLEILTGYRFYGFYVDTMYIITSKLQIDTNLMNKVWGLIAEMWLSGNRIIPSESLLKALEEDGENVPDYALDRVLEYLTSSNCIRGASAMGSDAIRRHGNMRITWINPNCHIAPLASFLK